MIYLACPYSSKDPAIVAYRVKRASEYVASKLEEREVLISPVVYGHNIVQETSLRSDWDFWSVFCIDILRRCEKLYVLMLEGWEESEGVKGEIELARKLNIQIVYVSI